MQNLWGLNLPACWTLRSEGYLKTHVRFIPSEIPKEIAEKVIADVVNGLQSIVTIENKFIVNDTLWFALQGKKHKKPTPIVVNSAHFITKRLQNFLKEKAGWSVESLISGQQIDAYTSLDCGLGMVLEKKAVLELLQIGWSDMVGDPSLLFSNLYQNYFLRKCFRPKETSDYVKSLFKQADEKTKIRFGLEFETGNIASSFRAFSKLNSLFKLNEIDAGIFITSCDKKSAACRIWPTSNRNGSFEELENRDYRRNIDLPLIELSFAPDDFDSSAGYLGSNGKLYFPKDTGTIKTFQHLDYRVFIGEDGNEILLRC